MTLYNPCSTKLNCEGSTTSRGAILFQALFPCGQWGMTGKEEPPESRAMGLGNYPRKENQESQELTLLWGQGSHRVCPAGFNNHLGQVTVGCLPFISFTNERVFPVIQFPFHQCLLDVMGKAQQKTHFSSSKPLTPWREIGVMEKVIYLLLFCYWSLM